MVSITRPGRYAWAGAIRSCSPPCASSERASTGAAALAGFYLLKSAKPGLLGTEAIKWNFTKFLVDRDGNVVARFAPNDTPESIGGDIEKAL